jgi:hypothetical protein
MDPGVERQLATAATDELLNLEACAPAVIANSQQAYPFAKRANQLRVAAAAGTWGRRGARINSISPGIISTAMGRQELDGDSGQMMRAMVDSSATGRVGTPDDIAAAADFLLSPAASFITGTDLLVTAASSQRFEPAPSRSPARTARHDLIRSCEHPWETVKRSRRRRRFAAAGRTGGA